MALTEKPPWRWEKFDDSYGGFFWALKDAEGKTIIHLVGEDSKLTEQRKGLIAAGPEMLDLLLDAGKPGAGKTGAAAVGEWWRRRAALLDRLDRIAP